MAVNQQTLEGNWNEIKGKLRERWGNLNQDELQQAKGNIDQLVGLIQRQTGEARDKVEKFLTELTTNGSGAVSKATENVRNYAQQAAENVQGMSQQATDKMKAGYEETERVVRERPFESLAVCFGEGIVTGLFVGLMMRSK